MSHTPGPWSQMQDGDEPYWCVGMNGKGPQHGHCMVYTNEDDARLVAAAPELLAALKSVASQHSHIETANMPEWLEAVEDAIAKAEGRGECAPTEG